MQVCSEHVPINNNVFDCNLACINIISSTSPWYAQVTIPATDFATTAHSKLQLAKLVQQVHNVACLIHIWDDNDLFMKRISRKEVVALFESRKQEILSMGFDHDKTFVVSTLLDAR